MPTDAVRALVRESRGSSVWRHTRACGLVPRSFYARRTLTVARALLGKVLVHHAPDGVLSGIIVETEAYVGESDPACHAAPGPTPRNEPLYGHPGVAYVYLNYGVHCLLNAVTEPAGRPAAVLIRALEPVDGIDRMRAHRHRAGRALPDAVLCQGPGNLSRALGVTLAHNRVDLTAGPLVIEDRGLLPRRVRTGTRIGIRVGVERPWRFWVDGAASVSRL